MSEYYINFLKVLVITAIAICLQTKSYSNPHVKHSPLPTWDAINEAWTDDDQPYIKIQTNIDKAVKNKRELEHIVKHYAEDAQKSPLNTQAQFALGYALFAARQQGYPTSQQNFRFISLALAKAPVARTYQYTRLRYLAAMAWGTFPELKAIGQRLLRQKPNDYEVKYYLTKILSTGPLAERHQALSYAQELVQSAPKRPSAYSALAGVYKDMYFAGDGSNNGDEAINAYHKYLQLIPSTDTSRRDAEYLIKLIHSQQEKVDKGN